MEYIKDFANYSRFRTRVIPLRHFDLGGQNYIRLQSMTNTDTRDIEATVAQCERIIEQGADYLRLTVPTMKDVEALDEIRRKLRVNYETPLIADIHFTPKVAYEALLYVEKIRINPGNFVDRKKKYSAKEYKAELEKIKEVLQPIVRRAKKLGRAIRIGTNLGSLSERILQKYGATVEGMVQATLEYVDIMRELDFHNLVISLKASNVRFNIWANRLLVKRFIELGYDYPLHLGVTEAGNGLEARIKSAIGIGGLLIDGIGDTIRVSLSEPPENEIPVARKIVNYALERRDSEQLPVLDEPFFEMYSYKQRKITTKLDLSWPIVVTKVSDRYIEFDRMLKPDILIVGSNNLKLEYEQEGYVTVLQNENGRYFLTTEEYLTSVNSGIFVGLGIEDLEDKELVKKLKSDTERIILFTPTMKNKIGETRWFVYKLKKLGINMPVVLHLKYSEQEIEDLALKAAIDSGIFFVDGLINGLFIENSSTAIDEIELTDISFKILQASGSRYTKAEIVACPSCGRSTFDVEKITNLVRERLSGYKGIKIAVMGCIVNGLGEMADADFAYVGTNKGKVSLYYKGKLVKHNIDESEAIDELEKLIREKTVQD